LIINIYLKKSTKENLFYEPPVNGCRMFIASPSIIIPSRALVEGGKKELGIVLIRSVSTELRKDD